LTGPPRRAMIEAYPGASTMIPALLALAWTVSAPALKDKPVKGPPLIGRWVCTKLVLDGQDSPQWKGLEYEFTADGHWLIYRDGQALDEKSRTYRLDPKTGPEVIDLTEGPAPYVGMFKAEADTMTMSFRTGGTDRPAGPAATGQGLMTFTFKRVKGKD
jgi:uncharacterized protein (TIGR03067 family)